MATDGSGMVDGVDVQLNAPDEPAPDAGTQLRRPAASAPKSAWVDYCVGLGADRAHLEGGTRHWSEPAGEYVPAAEPTRDELVDLADRLGG